MSSTGASVAPERARAGALRIIAGPTGAGKSALALALAERHGATIISADSRQVYRGFDIGTAKPTPEERTRVRHEGIDVAAPHERWSAARWAEAARGWIAEAEARAAPVLVVGGTGLWLNALVTPLAEEPPLHPDRRLALQRALAAMDTTTLRRWVTELDAPRAGGGRTQLLRAIEVALLSGTRISDWHARGSPTPALDARWLIVDPGEDLASRIERRLDAMLMGGWEKEVRALMALVAPDAPAWNACGYREIRGVVEGRTTRDAARRAVLVATRQYAKRQRTWFRNQLGDAADVTRIDPREEDAVERADAWFARRDTNGGGRT